MSCLVWDSPDGRVVFDLDRSIVIVGSDAVSDFCVRDPSVSKRHALVQVDDDGIKITDLGSEAGTKINGASLMPDLPSTLEPGDFVHVGKVVLTYHHTRPPAAAAPAAPPGRGKARKAKAKPRATAQAAPAGAPAGAFPWKWVAFGLAFLLVGCLGALIALSVKGGGDDEKQAKGDGTEQHGKADPAPKKSEKNDKDDDAAPKKKQDPMGNGKEPDKPVKKQPEIIEALPPNAYATVEACPDLIEAYGAGFLPAKVETWDLRSMTVVGADGKRYRFKRGDMHRVVDRADLARRARKRIERQPVEEIKNCFLLAQWCFKRHVRGPLKPFLKRVVAQRPDDPSKKFLETIEAEERDS